MESKAGFFRGSLLLGCFFPDPGFFGVGSFLWVVLAFVGCGPRVVYTWRIIPVSKWLVTTIYKPFRPFGRGLTLLGGLTNHGY